MSLRLLGIEAICLARSLQTPLTHAFASCIGQNGTTALERPSATCPLTLFLLHRIPLHLMLTVIASLSTFAARRLQES